MVRFTFSTEAKGGKEKNLIPLSFSSSSTVSGETVNVGYGIVAKELQHNDYKGKNVKGKIVVVKRFVPKTKKFNRMALRRKHGDLNLKAFKAREQGAIGMIVIDDPAQGDVESPLPALSSDSFVSNVGIPVIALKRSIGKNLLNGNHKATVGVVLNRQKKLSSNIVGYLPSTNDEKQKGAIIVGAHYDHLGYGGSGSLEIGKKIIHNGADDNASGTSALITIAKLLKKKTSFTCP